MSDFLRKFRAVRQGIQDLGSEIKKNNRYLDQTLTGIPGDQPTPSAYFNKNVGTRVLGTLAYIPKLLWDGAQSMAKGPLADPLSKEDYENILVEVEADYGVNGLIEQTPGVEEP